MNRSHAKGLTLATAILMALAGLAGCTWEQEEMPPALTGDPVVIGVPLPLTGAMAAFGTEKRNAYEMAAEELNAAGGIDGRPLLLLMRDTAGEPESATSVAEELIAKDGACLLLGEYSSACALAVAAVAQKRAVPYLVDCAVADSITQQKASFVFRCNPPAGMIAQGLSTFFDEVVRPDRMAIVYERSDYGLGMARAMRYWCEDTGVALVALESYDPGELDFGGIIEKVKAARPDVVYMVSYLLDASLLVRQARQKGLAPKLFAGGGAGFVLPEFIANTGQDSEAIATAALWAPSLGYPGAAEFAETYLARYGTYPGYHAAESYAAVYVAADALRRAASTDPERLRVALADTDLLTVFGPVKFEKFGKYLNQNQLSTIVLQVLGSKLEVIWPPECATGDYVYPDPAYTKAGGK